MQIIDLKEQENVLFARVTERRVFMKIADQFHADMTDLIDEYDQDVVLDLSDTSVMNSTGIGVLLWSKEWMERKKRCLVLLGLHSLLLEVLQRMQVMEFFETADTREQALEKIDACRKRLGVNEPDSDTVGTA
ncbi:STAS domain-containing protein [candidate division KSB1 bacterium]|nr:STAS domain-containing protein [candidate division KSB1 bacterium]